jgi:hypothetical protein
MPKITPLTDIAEYHRDAVEALTNYFSTINPKYTVRFFAYVPADVAAELAERLTETELRSILAILARAEAAFYIDYKKRSNSKDADVVSMAFRKIWRNKKEKARWKEEILDTWRSQVDPAVGAYISNLKGLSGFRHWLAHGRYTQFGPKDRFEDIYLLVENLLTTLPLKS